MLRFILGVLLAVSVVGAAQADTEFAIDLSFDAASAAELAQREEWVIVSVWLYGEPSDEGQAHADEMGLIYLGTEEITLRPVSQRVKIAGNVDPVAAERWLAGPVRANVNVYTARFTDENNLISCDLFEDDISAAQADVPQIGCTLIGL